MPYYMYNLEVNKQGDHEVHKETCDQMPRLGNRKTIGWFTNCEKAIAAVKEKTGKDNFNGCFYCCKDCHTN